MFSLIFCKRLLFSSCNYVGDASTHLSSLLSNASSPLIVIRSFSSVVAVDEGKKHEEKQEKHSFTVSYLINSCGLSPESAASVSKNVNLTSPERLDSVLRLLRDNGFTNTDIAKLVQRTPRPFLSTEKTLLSKLEYLKSIGVSRSDLPKIICKNPILLSRSLEKLFVPCYDLLKSLTSDAVDEKLIQILKRSSWFSLNIVQKNVVTNVIILKEHGVVQSSILMLLLKYPSVLTLKADKFGEHVKKAIEMGLDPSRVTFAYALRTLAQMSKLTWEHKMEVYRKWDLSNKEIHLAFRKHPLCMKASEEKITCIMEFLVNKMGWQPSDIARCPTVLCYSLEKRIVPRCSVIRVLLFRGLIRKEIPLSSVMTSTQKAFLDMFVSKYQNYEPELLSIFQGKTDLLQLGIGFGQTSTAKLI